MSFKINKRNASFTLHKKNITVYMYLLKAFPSLVIVYKTNPGYASISL